MTAVGDAFTPQLVDARMSAQELTLPQMRRAIPQECLVVSAWRSWAALFRVLACAAVCVAVLTQIHVEQSLWQLPSLVGVWLIYGWVLVGLFVLGHDCGHRSFSRRKWVNTVVGHICLSPLANSYHAWRVTHDHHHAYTQLRGQDVDWASYLVTREEYEATRPSLVTRIGYAIPFGAFFWIWWNSLERAVAIHRVLSLEVFAREKRRLRTSSVVVALTVLAIYGGLWYATGFWGMLKYYGVPAMVAMATGWVIIAIQHANEDSLLYEKNAWTPAKGQVVSTFDTRFPRWLEVLWCGINFHIPHHVSPGIPWYNLEKAAHALREAYPQHYQEHRFRLRDLLAFYRTPFLKKVAGEGYFVFDATMSR